MGWSSVVREIQRFLSTFWGVDTNIKFISRVGAQIAGGWKGQGRRATKKSMFQHTEYKNTESIRHRGSSYSQPPSVSSFYSQPPEGPPTPSSILGWFFHSERKDSSTMDYIHTYYIHAIFGPAGLNETLCCDKTSRPYTRRLSSRWEELLRLHNDK